MYKIWRHFCSQNWKINIFNRTALCFKYELWYNCNWKKPPIRIISAQMSLFSENVFPTLSWTKDELRMINFVMTLKWWFHSCRSVFGMLFLFWVVFQDTQYMYSYNSLRWAKLVHFSKLNANSIDIYFKTT